MKQPTTGGSYVYDPETEELTQVEAPTRHLDPNEPAEADKPTSSGTQTSTPGKRSK
ncbi:hypothetical protein [Rhizobium leguminosarum]|uniref:hypothetical protein n=1 Tax=Rhizobium leguminosarum TaxID=384 RepID=UPI00140F6EC8|nr:hypothetical protein [Rhizobium leguminosarum]QIO60687.1 hypothetical protein HA463_24535 [Rhizobium leguminosarum bv. trifolii]